ncbi:winged helix-turn-helix domain-containing protein [Sphingomonas sp. JC676]|uniref:winged helix-turn-helix domain-containing protein n=1 Tax=Sphingomonas sp. JC676 TaxID=2768065 RepID=UPI0016578EF8|nr:winged helix-turn-helix domain-containing protein [Sphingomonas sp. JC676]MBC9030809.1 winged helix-turn-helix domain-containing protein [Sphingomonas sp. JC676]
MLEHGKVDLAHEPEFILGRLTGSPWRRELVRDDGARELLEHRVMQVLIVLVRARGTIVTRDELAFSCWDGRSVSEDAINRVMFRLRKLASGVGTGSFRLETVTKLGYRLVAEGGEDDATALPSPARQLAGAAGPLEGTSGAMSRRGLALAATSGLIAAIGGKLLYDRLIPARAPPELERLMSEAQQLAEQNTDEGQYQAIGLLRRVVATVPDYAEGWGRLGIAYAVPSHYRERPEALEMRRRAEAAGRRALALDPGNAYGELALGIAVPFVGYWMARDQHFDRARQDLPDDDTVLLYRAVQAIFVGRSSAAVPLYERIKRHPFTPATYNNYIQALWCAGRIEETERALEDAASLYPTQATLWFAHFNICLFGGRPGAALQLAQNPEGRPDMSQGELAELAAQARAIESRDPREAKALMAVQAEGARRSARQAQYAIRLAGALGRLDDAFAIANAYYFSRGYAVPDFPKPGSSVSPDQRQTRLLFEPQMAELRKDPRFARLIEEIGLARYWRESGTQPDFQNV